MNIQRVRMSLETLSRQIVACRRCPRLVAYRQRVAQTRKPQYQHWEYWGRPVPGFGDPAARLLIVGLAPAAHGGNRTGRVFTGDPSAVFLMRALHEAGFANQPTSEHREDGLRLRDAYIAAAVRCAPPQNRPTSREERNCLPYLVQELTLLSNVRVVLALGGIAFSASLRALSHRAGQPLRGDFRHGAEHVFGRSAPALFASYHPSPRNTNTGRLSHADLVRVLAAARRAIGGEPPRDTGTSEPPPPGLSAVARKARVDTST